MKRVLREELPVFVRRVLRSLDSARDKSRAALIALHGDLGAGKTTFVQALAKELGITETVQSPTYVLMKKYQISQGGSSPAKQRGAAFGLLVHMDAYRLQNAKEFAALKPEEFLGDPKTLVVIEWPERVSEALPKPDLVIRFSSENTSGRERFVGIER